MLKPRETRHPVLIRAQMRGEGPTTEICVRNISTRGMLLQACRPPVPGSYIEVVLPGSRVTARVIWASDRRFGVSTRERIRLSDFVGTMREGSGRKMIAGPRARAAALAARRPDQAQSAGRAMQFVFLLLCGAVAAAFAAGLAFSTLAQLRETLTDYL